jgi:hypothetical protein
MNELKWEVLTEVQGRLEADLLKSYFDAHGVPVELFQEAVGHYAYPVTVDGLGRVQIFAPKSQLSEARELLRSFRGSE